MRLTTERFSSSLTVWQRSPAVQGSTKSRVLSDWVQEIDSVWHWARFGMHKYFSWLMLDQNVVSMLYIHAELPNNWYYLGRGKQHAQAWSGRNSCQQLLKDKALWVAEGKGLRLHRCGLQLLHGCLYHKAVSSTPPKFSSKDRYTVVASLRAMELLMRGLHREKPSVWQVFSGCQSSNAVY